jgi:5-methylcytosine-specific restriction endonuclease McrA
MKKSDRTLVWNKYHQRCAYCGKHLEYHELQVDHLIPRLGGRRPSTEIFENWMPSCRRCNHYKRSHSLEHFRKLLQSLDNRINDHYINKVAIDYGIIREVVPWDGVFYFEKYMDTN